MGNLCEPIVPTPIVSVHRERLTSHECGHSVLVILLRQCAWLPLDVRRERAIVNAAMEKRIHSGKTRPTALAFANAKRQPKLKEPLGARVEGFDDSYFVKYHEA